MVVFFVIEMPAVQCLELLQIKSIVPLLTAMNSHINNNNNNNNNTLYFYSAFQELKDTFFTFIHIQADWKHLKTPK